VHSIGNYYLTKVCFKFLQLSKVTVDVSKPNMKNTSGKMNDRINIFFKIFAAHNWLYFTLDSLFLVFFYVENRIY